MILTTFAILASLAGADLVSASKGVGGEGEGAARLDCVKASERCLREAPCSTKYRTMRQCVAGRHSAAAAVTAPEARGECRSAMEAIKQNPLNRCRCRRGMKKEKNCLRIFWSIYQSLQGNDLLEYSPYEPVNSRLSDIFRLAPIIAAEPASAKENNCLNAAKACNLNDTCKKYRSAYINPCTGRVSASEVCNKRKCHKALRHFFDKVPSKYSYGMLFCSCPAGDQKACAERRRQTIVPACSYEDRDKANCLSLQNACKTNYVCRRVSTGGFHEQLSAGSALLVGLPSGELRRLSAGLLGPHRYGHHAQLQALAGNQPVALVPLRRQRERQARVREVSGLVRQQPLPTERHPGIRQRHRRGGAATSTPRPGHRVAREGRERRRGGCPRWPESAGPGRRPGRSHLPHLPGPKTGVQSHGGSYAVRDGRLERRREKLTGQTLPSPRVESAPGSGLGFHASDDVPARRSAALVEPVKDHTLIRTFLDISQGFDPKPPTPQRKKKKKGQTQRTFPDS